MLGGRGRAYDFAVVVEVLFGAYAVGMLFEMLVKAYFCPIDGCV